MGVEDALLGVWSPGAGRERSAGEGALRTLLGVSTVCANARGMQRPATNEELLAKMGATPVGMPVPAVPEGLSKGVIDGTTIPWEVTGALKIPELVNNHTEFEDNALYVLTFVLAMNKDRYEGLPADLQKVIDDNSGLEFSIFAGGTQADADGPARQAAVDRGNNIVTVSGSDLDAWRAVSQPIFAEWVADMESKGIDGQALIDEARALMDAYEE